MTNPVVFFIRIEGNRFAWSIRFRACGLDFWDILSWYLLIDLISLSSEMGLTR